MPFSRRDKKKTVAPTVAYLQDGVIMGVVFENGTAQI